MKIEDQIIPLKKELNQLADSNKTILETQKGKLEKLIDYSTEFDNNWVGAWGDESYNYYNNIVTRAGGTIVINDEKIVEQIEKKSGFKIKDVRQSINEISKSNREFRDKIITELSVIKGLENLQPEIELLDKIEKHKFGMSPSDYVQMKQPKSIYTNNPAAILNKGLDTPPHLSVGGDLISLFTTFTAILDFQKNCKRLLRQIEIKFSIEESEPDKSIFIKKIINTFHTVAKQIQNRHAKRETIVISDEYDVQDLFHGLLRIEFEDVRAEEYTPSYAGSSTRMDFLLKKEKIVIEVKKTRDSLKDKEVGDQLIIDIQHYKSHPDCKHLICFVYDPENKIKNPRGLEADLNALTSEDLIVEVFIRP